MPQFFYLPFVLLAIVIVIGYVIVQFIKSRRQERSQMIEKGMNPFRDVDIEEFNKLSNLKNGVLLLSLGIGFLLGHVLNLVFAILDDSITYLFMVLICGGIGFIISYRLIKRS